MAVNKFDNSMFDAGTIGTTANKLLQMDGSAKIPAVDGTLLTGIPSSFTKSASDPVITTNPSGGVGTMWINTTSGEMYCCTDATAGANVWTNVGAGSGNIVPTTHAQGSISGYVAGGTGTCTTIDKFPFTSDASSTDVGNLTAGRYNSSGSCSSTYGYTAGGYPGQTTIDKYAFATDGNATAVGSLVTGTYVNSGSSSTTYGYTTGGQSGGNVIQKHSFSTDGNSTDVGDLTYSRQGNGTGVSSATHGYHQCGDVYSGGTHHVDKYSHSSDANATSVLTLNPASTTSFKPAGTNSNSDGYMMGGTVSFRVLNKYSFASEGTATNVGNLSTGRSINSGHSSTTHGYSSGGYGETSPGSGPNVYKVNIEKFSFASGGDATNVANFGSHRTGSHGAEHCGTQV